MRILLIHNRERKRGGESVAFDREAELLQGLGHQVLVLQKTNSDFERASIWWKACLLIGSVFNPSAYVRLRRTIRQFRPDVAVIHNAFPLWSVAVYIALIFAHVPIVQVVHNFRLRCLNGLYFRSGAPCTLCRDGRWWQGVRYRCVRDSWAQSLAYGAITQSMWPLGIVRRIDAFRVLSRITRDRLLEMGIMAERIHVIPNFSPALSSARQPTTDPTWVLMGHLGPSKGPLVVIDAMARGAPGSLVVIGGGPLESELQRRISDEKLPITFLGIQDGAERFEVLRRAWALVLPSLCFENGPLVVLEAFALGVPVVASRIGSIPEYVTDGVSGRLFTPGDDADLARVLRELASDATERNRLSTGAQYAGQHKFAQRALADEFVALLEATISRRRSDPPFAGSR